MTFLLTEKKFILASASPRRLELLRQVGVEPYVCVADVEEKKVLTPLLTASQLVMDNARLKALAVTRLVREQMDISMTGDLVLAADTVVVAEGQLMGKPQNTGDAARMLRLLSGRTHSVFTGQALIDLADGRMLVGWREVQVTFVRLEEAEIAAYVDSGEPLDKAGAYGLQAVAGLFVSSISGDYSAVVGLSLPLLREQVRVLTKDIR